MYCVCEICVSVCLLHVRYVHMPVTLLCSLSLCTNTELWLENTA